MLPEFCFFATDSDLVTEVEDIDPSTIEAEDIGSDEAEDISNTAKAMLLGLGYEDYDYKMVYELDVRRLIQEDYLLSMQSLTAQSNESSSWTEDQRRLGLTIKGGKNISDIPGFATRLESMTTAQALEHEKVCPTSGALRVGGVIIDSWDSLIRWSRIAGVRELSIRGSEKSKYGKKLERIILGWIAEFLGFTFTKNPTLVERTFSLNGRVGGTVNRKGKIKGGHEYDLFLYYGNNKGVVVDITQAKVTNSEAANNKSMLFESTTTVAGEVITITTCVITHELSKNGKKPNLFQMIDSDWVQQFAQHLLNEFSYDDHPLLGFSPSDFKRCMIEKLENFDVTKWNRTAR
jgi:hypothetical protein